MHTLRGVMTVLSSLHPGNAMKIGFRKAATALEQLVSTAKQEHNVYLQIIMIQFTMVHLLQGNNMHGLYSIGKWTRTM